MNVDSVDTAVLFGFNQKKVRDLNYNPSRIHCRYADEEFGCSTQTNPLKMNVDRVDTAVLFGFDEKKVRYLNYTPSLNHCRYVEVRTHVKSFDHIKLR